MSRFYSKLYVLATSRYVLLYKYLFEFGHFFLTKLNLYEHCVNKLCHIGLIYIEIGRGAQQWQAFHGAAIDTNT